MRVRDQLSSTDSPAVSVSCISYNQKGYIKNCIEGFLNQTVDFPVEILIHDDASTDGTREIIQTYAQKYPHIIKPVLQTENQFQKGVRCLHATYNFVRSKGDYIATCEGDDYWIDDYKLLEQVAFLKKNKEFTLSCHDVYFGYWNEKRNIRSASAIVWRNFSLDGFEGVKKILQRAAKNKNDFWISRRSRNFLSDNYELSLSGVYKLYAEKRINIPTLSIVGLGDLLRKMPKEIFRSPTGHREHILWLSMFGKIAFNTKVMGQKINQKNSMTQTKIMKELNALKKGEYLGLKDYLSKFIALDIPETAKITIREILK